MNKKKLKRRLERMEARINSLEERARCERCENHKPKKVQFMRWFPLDSAKPIGGEKDVDIHPGEG